MNSTASSAKFKRYGHGRRRAQEALDAVPSLLDKFRQAILAAAFSGDLTADWRTKHDSVEPAAELLRRVRVERRTKWEESEVAKMTAKASPRTTTMEGEVRGSRSPQHFRATHSAWRLVLGNTWGNSEPIHSTPYRRDHSAHCFTTPTSYRTGSLLIAVGNLTGVGFRREGLYFVTSEKARELERFDVQAGDVLFARSGATTGKVWCGAAVRSRLANDGTHPSPPPQHLRAYGGGCRVRACPARRWSRRR